MGAMRYGQLFRRSLVVLPFVALIGLFNVFYERTPVFRIGTVSITEGWIGFASILLRGLLSVQALLLLIRSTGYYRLCRSMQRMGMPSLFAAQLLFVFRYLRVLVEEAIRMKQARDARGYGRSSYPLPMWGTFVGQLMIRTFDRAELVYRAMLARGFTGRIPDCTFREQPHWRWRDSALVVRRCAAFVFIRLYGPAETLRADAGRTSTHSIDRMSHHYLQFDNVHYTYPDGHEALRGITFRITHGERVALVGVNGAGKSTLLLHTNGLLLPTQGRISVGGIEITRKTLPRIRQTVGLVFQDADDQLFMPTVEEDVAFGPSNMGLTREEIALRVTRALEAVGAESLRQRFSLPTVLSGGQKKSVSIATVLSMEPSILVMDEPTSNLDPHARRQVIDLLARFDHTMLIATHDMDMIPELCPRTIVMKDGRIVADGQTARIFGDRALVEACGLEQPHAMRAPAGFPAYVS